MDRETPPPPTSLAGWYRFALLMTGHPETATRILAEALEGLGERFARLRTPTARREWMVARLRKEARRNGETPPQEPWGEVAALAEPGRTAYALYLALGEDLPSDDELLEPTRCRTTSELADALASARSALNRDALVPHDALLPLHAPWRVDAPAVGEAVKAAEAAELAPFLTQVEMDRMWRARLLEVSPPEGLSLPMPSPEHTLFRHPAVLAIAVAMLVMVGAGLFLAKEQLDDFPGKELVSSLVEDHADSVEEVLEPLGPEPMDRLADWFLLKGFDDFVPPAELRQTEAEGGRVFRYEGLTVAHLALVPKRAEFFAFQSAQLKSRVESREWRSFQHDDLAVATRSEGPLTYVVVVPGGLADLAELLNPLRPLRGVPRAPAQADQ